MSTVCVKAEIVVHGNFHFIGGCGACVVLLSTYDPKHDKVEEFAVSSCLTLLFSINLCSVTTTEGLGNIKDGFHSIHQRFSGFHASQCGFCTPGMCMSLFSALVNADKSKRSELPVGFSKITVSKAEKAIAGNLCRCTGYRSIADACKSFASDVDLEDLGFNAFWKKGEKDAKLKRLPFYGRDGICTFPDFLKSEINSALDRCSNSLQDDQIDLDMTKLDISNNSRGMTLAENNWYRPNSIDDLYKMLNCNELTKSSIKMIVGNTGSGVYKEQDLYEKYIDLRGIPELSDIKVDIKGIKIGAAVTISKTIEILKEEHEGLLPPSMRLVFTKLADHMDKVASQFVRNTASLGGNLVMAQRNQFPSDIATILIAVGASVCIQVPSKRLILTLEEFLRRPPCDQGTLLLSIFIPYWNSSKNPSLNINSNIDFGAIGEPVLLFETYRAAPRPLGNAVAYLNAAFLAQISLHKISGDLVLDDLCLAFGAYGNKHAIRARKVENFLVGKSVTASVLLEAIRLLRETIVPTEGTTYSDYRSSLAVAFLFKFLQPLLRGLIELGNDALDISNAIVPAECLGGRPNGHSDALPMKESKLKDLNQPDNNDLLLTSKQLVGYSTEYHPVGEPTKKVGAEIQASGISSLSFSLRVFSVTFLCLSFCVFEYILIYPFIRFEEIMLYLFSWLHIML